MDVLQLGVNISIPDMAINEVEATLYYVFVTTTLGHITDTKLVFCVYNCVLCVALNVKELCESHFMSLHHFL